MKVIKLDLIKPRFSHDNSENKKENLWRERKYKIGVGGHNWSAEKSVDK